MWSYPTAEDHGLDSLDSKQPVDAFTKVTIFFKFNNALFLCYRYNQIYVLYIAHITYTNLQASLTPSYTKIYLLKSLHAMLIHTTGEKTLGSFCFFKH